jgi:hypothetical protein
MLWITRSHVHVDRMACPWLITRFIDSDAEFLFVPSSPSRRMLLTMLRNASVSRWGTLQDTFLNCSVAKIKTN